MRIESATQDDWVDKHRVLSAKTKVREFVKMRMPQGLKKKD